MEHFWNRFLGISWILTFLDHNEYCLNMWSLRRLRGAVKLDMSAGFRRHVTAWWPQHADRWAHLFAFFQTSKSLKHPKRTKKDTWKNIEEPWNMDNSDNYSKKGSEHDVGWCNINYRCNKQICLVKGVSGNEVNLSSWVTQRDCAKQTFCEMLQKILVASKSFPGFFQPNIRIRIHCIHVEAIVLKYNLFRFLKMQVPKLDSLSVMGDSSSGIQLKYRFVSRFVSIGYVRGFF